MNTTLEEVQMTKDIEIKVNDDKMCRLCALQFPPTMLNTKQQLVEMQLDQTIKKLFEIELNNNCANQLPKSVCQNCCTTILKFNEYCLQVANAQNQFNNILFKSSTTSAYLYDSNQLDIKLDLSDDHDSYNDKDDSEWNYFVFVKGELDGSNTINDDQSTTKLSYLPIDWKCYKCNMSFRLVSKLNQHFQLVHQSNAEYVCVECNGLFNNINQLERHIGEHGVTRKIKKYKIYKCQVCCKEFNSKTNFDTHQYVHSGEKRFTCDLCDKKFTLKQHMQVHKFTVCQKKCSKDNDDERIISAEIVDSTIMDESNAKKIKWKCNLCNKFLQSEQYLEQHFNEIHQQPVEYVCMKCDATFMELNQLQLHSKQLHQIQIKSMSKLFKCDTCDKQFSNKTNFNSHQLIHLEMKQFECMTCNKKCTTKQQLEGHQLTHIRSTITYDCNQCDKKCKTEHLLQRHLRMHMPLDERLQFQCQLCIKKFASEDGLKGHHKQMHDDSNHVICDKCGKYFPNKYRLDSHIKIHFTDASLRCNICAKSFRYMDLLKRHQTIHSGLKPHACEFCGKTFRLNGMLKRHMTVHSNETPFQCTYCMKAFRAKEHLRIHIRQHTGEKPYSCTVCNHHFTNDSNFIKHLKGRHGLKNFSIVNNHQYPFVNQQ